MEWPILEPQRLERHNHLIIWVDIERSSRFSDQEKATARGIMFRTLERAFASCGVRLDENNTWDRGDGALIVLPATVSKDHVLSRLPAELIGELAGTIEHGPKVRLRIAVDSGEVALDDRALIGQRPEYIGERVDRAHRLLDAKVLKDALAASKGATVALIVSETIYDEVIRQIRPEALPGTFRRVRIVVKETHTWGFICLPGVPDSSANPIRSGESSPGIVADLILRSRRDGEDEQVSELLNAYSQPGHRQHDFKAKLYTALKDRRLGDDADELLRLSLDNAIGSLQAADGVAEVSGILQAGLTHSSSSAMVVKNWIDMDLRRLSNNRGIDFLADLLAQEPDGENPLCLHVGSSWKPYDVVVLCGVLKGKSLDAYAALCDSIAARTEIEDLALTIQDYAKAAPSRRDLEDLLAKVVAPRDPAGSGARVPHSTDFLDELAEHSRLRGDPRLVRSLRIAAAKHVEGRSGREIAYLLGKVEGQWNLWHTAIEVNENLVDGLRDGQIDADRFIDYVSWLREDQNRPSDLVFWAMGAFSNPARPDWDAIAPMAGDIGARLYAKDLDGAAFELLTRFLGNEQMMTTEAARRVVVSAESRHHQIRDDRRWDELWESAVGGWADADHRRDVIEQFQKEPDYFRTERRAISRSVQ